MPSYPTETIAKLLLISPRHVQRLTLDGVLEHARNAEGEPIRGRYDMVKCVQGYIRYLRERNMVVESAENAFRQERVALAKLQKERAQLELELMKGTLVRTSEVVFIVGRMLSNFRAKLLAMPSKVARLLLGQPNLAAIIKILSEAVKEVLAELRAINAAELIAEERARLLEAETQQQAAQQGRNGQVEAVEASAAEV